MGGEGGREGGEGERDAESSIGDQIPSTKKTLLNKQGFTYSDSLLESSPLGFASNHPMFCRRTDR